MTSVAHLNYRLIHDIYVLLDAGDRRVLESFGLTTSQFRILSFLAAQPDWRLIDLSQAMLCARSTITRVVDGLEEAGWIRRIDHPQDRRAQRLTLTPAGQVVFEQARAAYDESLQQRLAVFSDEDQNSLNVLLHAVRQGLLRELTAQNLS